MLTASLRFVLCHGLLQRSTDAIKGGGKADSKSLPGSWRVTKRHSQSSSHRGKENRKQRCHWKRTKRPWQSGPVDKGSKWVKARKMVERKKNIYTSQLSFKHAYFNVRKSLKKWVYEHLMHCRLQSKEIQLFCAAGVMQSSRRLLSSPRWWQRAWEPLSESWREVEDWSRLIDQCLQCTASWLMRPPANSGLSELIDYHQTNILMYTSVTMNERFVAVL